MRTTLSAFEVVRLINVSDEIGVGRLPAELSARLGADGGAIDGGKVGEPSEILARFRRRLARHAHVQATPDHFRDFGTAHLPPRKRLGSYLSIEHFKSLLSLKAITRISCLIWPFSPRTPLCCPVKPGCNHGSTLL